MQVLIPDEVIKKERYQLIAFCDAVLNHTIHPLFSIRLLQNL